MIKTDIKSTSLNPRISFDTKGMALTASERQKLLECFPNGLIALDLETTGLSPLVDKIIEIAAFKITPSGDSVYETLINPEILIPIHTIAIHNISDEMVQGAPKLNEILVEFHQFLGDLPIVAHNAKFDLGFIVVGLQRLNIALADASIYCSCKMARSTFREAPNHKLSTLVKELNIPLENHHRALDDAFAALKIFIKSLERAESKNGLLFKLSEFDEIGNDQLPEHLEELNKLVKEAAVIEIQYSGGNHKNEFRPVKLTSLLNTPDGNILYARCLWSDMYKSFKLSKIKSIRHPSADDIQKWLLKKEK